MTLDPLGLHDTQVEGMLAPAADTAALYDAGRAGAGPSPAMDLSDRIPAGGYVSTALDLARFVTTSIEGQLLTPATRARMFRPQRTAAGDFLAVRRARGKASGGFFLP